MAELLDTDSIRDAVAQLDGWRTEAGVITRTVELAGFPEAIAAVVAVARAAEEMDHHPDIDIRWRQVTFRCSTHSAGGVTARDVALARRIDELLAGKG